MDNASKPQKPKAMLRLVTPSDPRTGADAGNSSASLAPADNEKPQLKSALARRLTLFADELDKQIAELLAQ